MLAALFRKPRAESSADPIDVEIRNAEAHSAACRETLELVTADSRKAHKNLELAEARVRAARARYDSALLDGGDVSAAQKVVGDAEHALADARNTAISADRGVETAGHAAIRADEPVQALRRKKKVAELRERASVARLHANTREPAMRLLNLRQQALAAAAEMDAAYLATLRACDELREMGEPAADVTSHQLLYHFAQATLDEDPSRAETLRSLLEPSWVDGASFFHSLGTAERKNERFIQNLVVPASDPIKRIFATPSTGDAERNQHAREDIEALFSERGIDAMRSLQAARKKARSRESMRNYVPSPRIRHHEQEGDW